MSSRAGDLIRSRRKARGLTQSQLGELLGVSQVAVSEWETGRSAPSDEAGIKRELGIDARDLLAAMVIEDDVVRAIYSNKKLSKETQKALVTIYEQVLKASGSN